MGSRTNVKMKHDIDSLHRIYHSSLVHSANFHSGALFVHTHLRADLQHCNRSKYVSVSVILHTVYSGATIWIDHSIRPSTSFARFILSVCIQFQRVASQMHSEWRTTDSSGCECGDARVGNFICKWNHQLSTWHYLIRLPRYRRKNRGLQANNNRIMKFQFLFACSAWSWQSTTFDTNWK